MRLLPILTIAALLTMSGLASAQVQRCVDNDGRVTFTDNVCPKSNNKNTSIKANQKYVGSETSTDTNWAPKNEAFNQRHAQREQIATRERINADNQRTIKEFMSTPLPPGVKYQRLTTYSDRPSKLESK